MKKRKKILTVCFIYVSNASADSWASRSSCSSWPSNSYWDLRFISASMASWASKHSLASKSSNPGISK